MHCLRFVKQLIYRLVKIPIINLVIRWKIVRERITDRCSPQKPYQARPSPHPYPARNALKRKQDDSSIKKKKTKTGFLNPPKQEPISDQKIGHFLSEYFGHVVHHVTKLQKNFPVLSKVLNDRPNTQALTTQSIYFRPVTSPRQSRVTRPPLPRLHADNRARENALGLGCRMTA